MYQPTLYIFSGLPASGKSTLAKELAKKIKAVYIRIDTVEQGLRDLCNLKIEGEGYRLSYRIVKDNLLVNNDVIADSVNPWDLTRREWNEVATFVGAKYFNLEVICSDQKEHQKRVETRNVDIENLELPTWDEVSKKDYHPWTETRIQIDTAGKTIEEAFAVLVKKLASEGVHYP